MGQYVLLLVVALTVGAVVFGVTVLVSGGDPGLEVAEPDGRAVPLPATRPLAETDIATVRFDTAIRGYRMAQVDRALQRAAYDIGYKDELISVLEAEVAALRDGRTGDAEVLRQAREAAQVSGPPDADEPDADDAGPAYAPDASAMAALEPAGEQSAPVDAPVSDPAGSDAGSDANSDANSDAGSDAAIEAPAEGEPIDASRTEADAPRADAYPADESTADESTANAPGDGAVPVDAPVAVEPAAAEPAGRANEADEPDEPTDRADGASDQPHPATADRR
jgi:DivIVA domain-containing protein